MAKSARQQDHNGFLVVAGCPISSFGIFQYSAGQVGLPGDKNRIVNVYRPESVISDPKFIESLQQVPVIDDHEMLSGFAGDETATAPEDYGVDGVLYNVAYDSPWNTGDIKVFTRKLQAVLHGGKADLSLGYTCDFRFENGTFEGQDYEVIQEGMEGNHIAVVKVGRVPGARVLDGKNFCFDSLNFNSHSQNEDNAMTVRRRGKDAANAAVTLKTALQQFQAAFNGFLNEEEVEPEHADPAAAGSEDPANPANPADAGATDPAATDPAVTDPAATDPDAGGEAGNTADLSEIAATLQGLLSQVQKAMAAPAASAAGEGTGDEGEMGAASAEGQGTGDEVTGLEATAREGADEGENGSIQNGGQGTASPGPTAGKHAGGDSAIRAFHRDLAAKNRLHDRLSKVVGAFDGAFDIPSATHDDIVAYGVKKLKLNVAPGQGKFALDAYLTGIEEARKTVKTSGKKATADAAEAAEVPAIDAYFRAHNK